MEEKVKFTEGRYLVTFIFVTTLFLMWGLLHSMSDVLNKHFQNVLTLSKSQSGLIQFSVFGAYFIMSIPAGIFLKKFGYKPGVIMGLMLFAAGALLFVPAANAVSFTYFRIALFILGCGMATLETVAHPFAAALGHQRTSDQRVNFAQLFNAVGAIIGPQIGSYFLFVHGDRDTGNLDSVKMLYVSIGGLIILIAIVFFFLKIPAFSQNQNLSSDELSSNENIIHPIKLFKQRHLKWAIAAQFFNVGAQAGTWAFFINYGHDVMGLSDYKAVSYLSVFMVMMALGRAVGTYMMKFVLPNRILAAFTLANIVMCLIVAQSWGWISYGALFMINFFFSIMFPTIFSLGIKSLGNKTEQASSYISMAVVGGAFFPMLMGLIANEDVAKAYYLPIICYLIIFIFAIKFYKVQDRSNQ